MNKIYMILICATKTMFTLLALFVIIPAAISYSQNPNGNYKLEILLSGLFFFISHLPYPLEVQ